MTSRDRRDRSYRPYQVRPDAPIEVVIHGRDGTHLRVVGIVDSVPWSAGNVAQRIVVVDAVAEVIES